MAELDAEWRRLCPSNTSSVPPGAPLERQGAENAIAGRVFLPVLRPAPEAKIHKAITEVYDAKEASGEKPPNILELPAEVQAVLQSEGYKASCRRIQTLARDAAHASRRRKPGATLKNERDTR